MTISNRAFLVLTFATSFAPARFAAATNALGERVPLRAAPSPSALISPVGLALLPVRAFPAIEAVPTAMVAAQTRAVVASPLETAPLPRAWAQAERAAEGAPPVLDGRNLFDGDARFSSAPQEPSERLQLTDKERSLADLAAPWRTQAQLDRLARSPRAPGETFRFALLGDSEPGLSWFICRLFRTGGVFGRLMRGIKSRPSDFVMHLGDMVSLGRPAKYRAFFQELTRLALPQPFLTTIGNHDRSFPMGAADSRLYQATFGRGDYYFDRGGVRFVVVDNSDGALSRRQLDWLDRTLVGSGRKVVFTHMPPAHLKELFREHPLVFPKFEKGAEEFTEIMTRRRVERVYSGHVHILSSTVHQGVRYVITGGGGSPLYPFASDQAGSRLFHHTLLVEVSPEGIRETVYKADGRAVPAPWTGSKMAASEPARN